MELEMIKKKDFPLLSRARYSFWYNENGPVPSRISLRGEVAKAVKATPELVVIKHIYSQYGKSRAKIIAHVYSDKEKMGVFENAKLVAKHAPKQAAPADKE